MQPAEHRPEGRHIPSVTRTARDVAPERHRVPTRAKGLRNIMCLGSWDLVFSEPVSYADFFHDIGPVVHRARDSNDNRFRRQPEKSVLTKPHQFRIGVIQPGRAARHPQGMFGRCDTEPASIVDRRVRHKSPYGHPSGGLRLTICHSFRRRGRSRRGSGCSRLMSPKVTLRLSGVHPSVDLGVVLTATHGADDGERPAGVTRCHDRVTLR
jgi:hypothetical protein